MAQPAGRGGRSGLLLWLSAGSLLLLPPTQMPTGVAVLGAALLLTGCLGVGKGALRRHRSDLRSRERTDRFCDVLDDLSYRDTETEAWNGRFLEAEFDGYAESLSKAGRALHLTLLEVDGFDRFSPEEARQLLRWLSAAFQGELYSRGHLFRTGDWEFSAVLDADEPAAVVHAGIQAILGYVQAADWEAELPSFSVGMLTIPPGQRMELAAARGMACSALAEARATPRAAGQSPMVCVAPELAAALGNA